MGKHKLQGEKHSVKRSLFMVLGLLGPGLVAALADNDAGGVISYAVTGANLVLDCLFRLHCLWC